MSLLKHPKHFILLFRVIVSHSNLASNFGPPYCAEISLLSHPYIVILLPYMAGGGVDLTLNTKMYVMCTILFPPPPWIKQLLSTSQQATLLLGQATSTSLSPLRILKRGPSSTMPRVLHQFGRRIIGRQRN